MAGMAKMEVSPQDEMANSQVMKMFAVERHGLPECFVSFRALCGVQSLSPVFGVRYSVVGIGRDSVLQVYVLLS